MKSILIPGATILFVIYVAMFFIDHRIWPEQTLVRVRNVMLILIAAFLTYNLINIYFLKNSSEESSLVYRIAATGKLLYTHSVNYIRPFRKELITWILTAAGLSILGLLLMGLPGALFLEIPVKLRVCERIQNDNAWPAFIFLSVLWPVFLPAGVFAKQYLIGHGHTAYALPGFIVVATGGIIFSMAITYWIFQE